MHVPTEHRQHALDAVRAFALLLGAGILLVALPWHPAGSLPLCAVTAALLPALGWLAARVLLLRR